MNHMKKTNVAIFFGGCSSEYSVSLESAYSVICGLNPEKYRPVPIGITPAGKWYFFAGDIEKIKEDLWYNDIDCVPAVLSPDRENHRLLLLESHTTSRTRISEILIDAAFPVMHGRNGEDGTIQGLIEMSGIPLVGCGVLASALCMDKDRAHQLARLAGIAVPESMVLIPNYQQEAVQKFAKRIGYPIFVKPVKAGSSYGISKVWNETELLPAITLAFEYDNEVILEETIDGFEVGCAVMGYDTLTVGEIDEIELSGGFFDYTEKYTLKTSAIHVPARVSQDTSERIKDTARTLYRALGCSGFARVDMFLTPDQRIVFNEINTIPGFTNHSRYPGMMKAAGISFSELLDKLIETAVMRA